MIAILWIAMSLVAIAMTTILVIAIFFVRLQICSALLNNQGVAHHRRCEAEEGG